MPGAFSKRGGHHEHRLAASHLTGLTIKCEEVYLRAYASVSESRGGIGRYLTFYNGGRPHSSLDGKTPDQASFNQPIPEAVAA